MILYCDCGSPIMDIDHDAGCRRCGRPILWEVSPDGLGVGCKWFVTCDNEATHLVAHPILGNVPCCDRCARIGA